MKGMPWFKVASDIAHDDDLEHVSDAAFRTFVELIATATEDASDGKVSVKRAQRMCNSPQFDDAITELIRGKFVKNSSGTLVIINYKKHQRTAKQIREMRDKGRDRAARYRESSNGVTAIDKRERESKSESQMQIEIQKQGGDALLDLTISELPKSDSTVEDYRRTIDRYRKCLTDEHIERVVLGLANYQPAKPYGPRLHLVLAKWLNKEPHDRFVQYEPGPTLPEVLPEDHEANAKAAAESRQQYLSMIAGLAGGMGMDTP